MLEICSIHPDIAHYSIGLFVAVLSGQVRTARTNGHFKRPAWIDATGELLTSLLLYCMFSPVLHFVELPRGYHYVVIGTACFNSRKVLKLSEKALLSSQVVWSRLMGKREEQ